MWSVPPVSVPLNLVAIVSQLWSVRPVETFAFGTSPIDSVLCATRWITFWDWLLWSSSVTSWSSTVSWLSSTTKTSGASVSKVLLVLEIALTVSMRKGLGSNWCSEMLRQSLSCIETEEFSFLLLLLLQLYFLSHHVLVSNSVTLYLCYYQCDWCDCHLGCHLRSGPLRPISPGR